MKNILFLTLVGALLGAAAASVLVPPMLSWYNQAGYVTHGNQIQSMVNVPDVVRYATNRLIRGQAIGAGIGAVLFLVFGTLLSRRGKPGKIAGR